MSRERERSGSECLRGATTSTTALLNCKPSIFKLLRIRPWAQPIHTYCGTYTKSYPQPHQSTIMKIPSKPTYSEQHVSAAIGLHYMDLRPRSRGEPPAVDFPPPLYAKPYNQRGRERRAVAHARSLRFGLIGGGRVGVG
jgi:hypothetical protein